MKFNINEMSEKLIIVEDQTVPGDKIEWVLSFTNHNPSDEESITFYSYEDAEKARGLIELYAIKKACPNHV